MAERSVQREVVDAIAAAANRAKREADETPAPPATGKRPRRACTLPSAPKPLAAGPPPPPPSRPLTGRVLVVHANVKTYGRGGERPSREDEHRLAAAKRSNIEDFAFAAADYVAMRDSGKPYSGDPRKNKLLPLPRPTYTEFINRAQRARALDRLDFVFCHPDAPQLPKVDFAAYERVVFAGVSFRRFAKVWRPERHHFFKPEYQRRVETVLLVSQRARREGSAFGSVPEVVLHDILGLASSKRDTRRDEYDDLATVNSGQRYLFLPAPGSSGIRDHLFDAVFGL